jgi:hypothetical protein
MSTRYVVNGEVSDVRFGSLADILTSPRHVRFTPITDVALREVWVQKAIADKLMALADSGVTDPQELRRRTLANFDFKPPH